MDQQEKKSKAKQQHLSNTGNDTLARTAFLPLCLSVPEQYLPLRDRPHELTTLANVTLSLVLTC